jgi:WD40 repeat protein
MVFSQNGQLLVSGSRVGTFYFDKSDLQSVDSEWIDDREGSVELAAGPDGVSLCRWDRSSHRAVLQRRTGLGGLDPSAFDRSIQLPSGPHSAAYSVDGRWMALGMKGRLQIFRPDSDVPVQTLPQEGDVTAVAFRPDGLGLSSASNDDDGTIQFWKRTDREAAPARQLSERERVLAVSPNGRSIATFADHHFNVFQTSSGRLLGSYAWHVNTAIWDFALRDDQHVIVAGATERSPLAVWNVADHVERIDVPEVLSTPVLCLSDDGRRLAVHFADGRLAVFDTADRSKAFDVYTAPSTSPLTDHPGTAPSAAASPAGQGVADSHSSVSDAASSVACMAFTHDNRFLAVYRSTSRTLAIVEIEGGRQRASMTVPGTGHMNCLEFSGDDSIIVCGQENHVLCLDATTGQKVVEITAPGTVATRLSFSRDDMIFSCMGPARDAVFVRPSVPATIESLQRIARLKLDDHDNTVALPAADENERATAGLTPPSSRMAGFWAAWWESRRRFALMEEDPTISISPQLLLEAREPLRDFVTRQPPRADLSPVEYEALANFRFTEPLKGPLTGGELDGRLALINERQPVERILLLTDLLSHLPESSTDRAKIHALVAFAYAEHVEHMKWAKSENVEKESETSKAFEMLNQAIALGYREWDDVRSSSFKYLKSDKRFPPQALSVEDR